MDTCKNDAPEVVDELNGDIKEKYRAHYKHMCEAGFDPLICTSRTFNTFNFIPVGDQLKPSTIKQKEIFNFVDLILNEERYVDLLDFSKTKVTDLDDVIFIPSNTVVRPMASMISSTAAVFWLYPSGCRTLGDLYKRYEKKIKDVLRHHIIT
jgi:hypothetical protein